MWEVVACVADIGRIVYDHCSEELYKLGRGPSIWDDFAHTKGRITNDDNGDIACDSYHKYKDDIKLLKEMGVCINWYYLYLEISKMKYRNRIPEPGTTISWFYR
jgi:hypothetical protein